MPHEEEVLYRPTQLLALLIESSGYDGLIYPSAMGSGAHIVLFNPVDVEFWTPEHVRIKRVGYFSEPLSPYEKVSEGGRTISRWRRTRFAPLALAGRAGIR